MRSDELLQRLRLNCTLEDSAADYPDAILLSELNDSLSTTFQDMIVTTRAGYWIDQYYVQTVTGQPKYRIPPRSCVQGLEKLEIGITSSGGYSRLHEVSEAHATGYELAGGGTGTPQAFVVRGDQVVLLPNPDSTGYTLRMHYYRRPSKLVQQQSSTLNSGVSRGLITAFDPVARTIVVNALPFDMEAVSGGVISPAAITGSSLVDIVHPDGWHECAAVDLAISISGTTLTVLGTADLYEVAAGDFVRAAKQSDWPQLPADYHRCLADCATVKVLAQRNMADKAGDFAQAVSADIARFANILQPRVKAEPLTIKAPLQGIRGRPRWFWPGLP